MDKDRGRLQGQVKEKVASPVVPVAKDSPWAKEEHLTKFTVERRMRETKGTMLQGLISVRRTKEEMDRFTNTVPIRWGKAFYTRKKITLNIKEICENIESLPRLNLPNTGEVRPWNKLDEELSEALSTLPDYKDPTVKIERVTYAIWLARSNKMFGSWRLVERPVVPTAALLLARSNKMFGSWRLEERPVVPTAMLLEREGSRCHIL